MPARQRILEIVLNGPRWTMALTVLFALSSLYFIAQLEISTSRKALVSPEHPVQANLVNFQNRFASTDIPILVVKGGTADERRTVLLEACDEIRKTNAAKLGEIFCRLSPATIAPVALTQDWAFTKGLLDATSDLEDIDAFVEQGWARWLPFIAQRAKTAVMQTQLSLFDRASASDKLEEAHQLLEGLVRGAEALRKHSEGTDPFTGFIEPTPAGLDDAGFLESPGGDALIAPLLLAFDSDEIDSFRPVITELRTRLRPIQAALPATMTLGLTGIPALNVDEYISIERGLWQSSIATTVGILVLFWLGFRSARTIIVAFIPLALGVLLTLTGAQLHFGGLNLITSSFISILLGLGIDLPVHWLSRVRESQTSGLKTSDAIRDAQLHAGRGIITGTLTTTLCFLTLARSEFTAFAELGIITALGLLLMLLTTFTVLPAAHFLVSPTHPTSRQSPDTQKIVGTYTRFVTRFSSHILFTGLVLSIAGIFVFKDLAFHYRYLDFVPSDTESAQLLRDFEESSSSGINQASVEVKSIEQGRRLSEKLLRLSTVDSVAGLHDFYFEPTEERIAALKSFLSRFKNSQEIPRTAIRPIADPKILESTLAFLSKTASFGALLSTRVSPSTSTQWNQTVEQLKSLTEDIRNRSDDYRPTLKELSAHTEPLLREALKPLQTLYNQGNWTRAAPPIHLAHRFQSKDLQTVALVITPKEDIWQGSSAERFIREVQTVAPALAGFATMLYEHSNMVISGFQMGALLASFLVVFLLWFDFRSIRDALTCLLPLTMGWCWMFVAMKGFGLELNVANIVVLPLILGIGVDTSVHILHRVREEERLNGTASLEVVMGGTGKAVLFAALTTMVGFAGLTVADNGAMKSLGYLMVLAITSTLGSSLVILPAWLSRHRVRGS